MDYDETIQSIAYSFLEEVEYAPRTEEEDEEFDFYEWWDESDKYDVLVTTVDSYAAGSWRSQMEIILASPTDPDHVDSGLWDSSDDWKRTVGVIAFELLRTDAYEWIAEHVTNNEPKFESGGVLPESNERQIWLGREAPQFIIEVDDSSKYTQRGLSVVKMTNLLKLVFPLGVLCFEGQPEHAEPRTFTELALGGRVAIRPRRLYTQAAYQQSKATAPVVQTALALALTEGWVTIPDYDHYTTLLPQLSVR